MAAADKKKKDVKDEDQDDENEKNSAEEPQNKGSKLKLIIILVVVLALLGGGGAAAYFIFFKAKGAAEKKQEAKPQVAVFLPMDPFIVNLIDTDGERYLKVVMQLELSDQLMLEEVKKINPKIRDSILELLGAKTYKEMIDPLGKQKLRDEIAMRANLVINSPKGKVVKVYFTEFVIQ